MTTAYPSAVDTLSNPGATDTQDGVVGNLTHSSQHANANDAIEAIETELGTTPKGTYGDVAAAIADTIVKTPANAAGGQTITINTATNVGLVIKSAAVQSGVPFKITSSADATIASVSAAGLVTCVGVTTTGTVTITDVNVALGTATGTKFGTAASQKLAFYNSTPIIQPSGAVLTALSDLGLVATPSLASTALSDTATLSRLAAANVFTVGQMVDGTVDEVQLKVQGNATQTTQPFVVEQSDGTDILSVGNTGVVTLIEGGNLVVGTTTGTQIGTGATQKLGFYGAAPIVQPVNIIDAAGGATVDAEARTAINALLAQVRLLGITAAA